MRANRRAAMLAGGAVSLFALGGCRTEPPPWVVLSARAPESGELIRLIGTVEWNELEGGFFAIRARDGTTYEAMNLPDRFQVDGLPIEAEAIPRGEMASIRMVGPIVELVRIRERATAGTADGAPGEAPGGRAP